MSGIPHTIQMSDEEKAAALEAIQLELFALERQYGDLVADFYTKRREILKRRRRLLKIGQTPILATGQKQCRKCSQVKDINRFYKEARYADERRPYCIECDSARMKEYNIRRKGNVLSRGSRSEAA